MNLQWTPVAETKRLARAPRALAPAGTFAGYASLFGKVDLGGDIVMRGAFAASLARRGAGGIRMLFQHDPAEPIGTWQEMREDSRGLYVRGRLALGVARAREVWELLAHGAVDGLSIGFKAERAMRDPRDGVRRLERVDLWEVSIVTFPMLPGARVGALEKSGASGPPKAGATRPRTGMGEGGRAPRSSRAASLPSLSAPRRRSAALSLRPLDKEPQ